MSDDDSKKYDDGFSDLQNIVWRSAAIVEALFLLLFGSRVTDLSDPIIATTFVVILLVGIWLTRKYVRTSVTDEYIRSFGQRNKK